MKKIITKAVVALMLVSSSMLVLGVDVPSRTPGTKFNLADPAEWGGSLPTASDKIIVKTGGYQFYASEDVNFKSMQLQDSKGTTNVFELTPGRKINFSGGGYDSYYKNAHTTFNGGELSMSGNLVCGATTRYGNCTVILTNAVKVTASDFKVTAGSYISECFMLLTDGVDATATGRQSTAFSAGASNSVFRIEKNSSYTMDECLVTGGNCYNNSMCIDGEGTVLTGTMFRPFRSGDSKNKFIVSNGAVVDFSKRGAHFCEVSASSNVFVFTSGAVGRFGNATSLNAENSSFANLLEVSDGARVEFEMGDGNSFEIGGHGQSEVVVSNATLSCKGALCLGSEETSVSNRLLATGSDSEIITALPDNTSYILFGPGGGNEIILDDYATWHVSDTNPVTLVFNSYNSNAGFGSNTVHVANGAKMFTHHCWLGTAHGGNTLRVTGGGEFTMAGGQTSLKVAAPGTTVALSNGVVRTLNENASITFGKNFSYGSVSSDSKGDRLVIEGTNSLMYASGDISFENEAQIIFDVPRDGYLRAPLSSNRLSFSADCVLTVKCAALRKILKQPARIVLAETVSGITMPEEPLAATNAALAGEKSRIYIDGKCLMLEVRPDRGLAVLLR